MRSSLLLFLSPARTSRTCWSLPGFGRKLPYIVDPDRPVRAIAPCVEAEGAKAHTQLLREAPSYC